MFIVCFKRDGEMSFQAKYVGPFLSFDEACEALRAMPNTLAVIEDDGLCPSPGYKFIQELTRPSEAP